MKDEAWIWVSLPEYTFGLVVRDGTVTQAAPIARWSVGRGERSVADYFRGRGAVFVRLPEVEHGVAGMHEESDVEAQLG